MNAAVAKKGIEGLENLKVKKKKKKRKKEKKRKKKRKIHSNLFDNQGSRSHSFINQKRLSIF